MGFLYSQLFVTPAYPTHSFKDQTIIVTGSNVGLGLEAARHFVRLNAATVILAVRNRPAGEAAKASIQASHPDSATSVEVWDLDLASYASPRLRRESLQSPQTRRAALQRLHLNVILPASRGPRANPHRQCDQHRSAGSSRPPGPPPKRSEEGKQVQAKVWGELREILEEIKPGVTDNVWYIKGSRALWQ
ncbi:hypothetical protein KXV22_002782 [Aspergillus fumigatus]|nr:hypothetical protein KXX14_008406 [Aspergillus fumigatus]KAH1456624.1 hypothetical protein KXX58_000478 [Aspergillus fumigatus]KAH1597965.1 hypothetical protein KXX34_008556 [Aspergillus fumigatus]KAH1666183.1 hypothetical protein KXX65_000515 [Aspergillus fumigatus]KAH1741136.1 hypothetical protein KXX09_002377 [Aspergillus fumigatus]